MHMDGGTSRISAFLQGPKALHHGWRGDRQCRRRGGTFKQYALARIKAWALVKIKAL
ncbi:hypothetical protein M422DRAFT_35006, partial [Sphaerobolus stellatus SS14]